MLIMFMTIYLNYLSKYSYYILEYMSDAQAHLYEIVLHVIETIQNPPHEIFKLEGVEWTKQLYGKALSGWTLGRVSQCAHSAVEFN